MTARHRWITAPGTILGYRKDGRAILPIMGGADDDDYDDDGQDDRGQRRPQTDAEWAEQRRQRRDDKRAAARAQDLEKENAFLRAGIDPKSEGIAGYFFKGYDADLDPSKITEAAIKAGVIAAPTQTPEQVALAQQQAEALAAQQRISGTATAQGAAPNQDDNDRIALAEAYKTGGIDALTSTLANQGIPITQN